MGNPWKPVVIAMPTEVVDSFYAGVTVAGLRLSRLSLNELDVDELTRLLGPLEFQAPDDDSNAFERWLATPDGCHTNVLLWWPKRQDNIRYQRLLREGETLVLVSGAYAAVDRDANDLAATIEVVKLLTDLGGRNVTQEDRWIVRAMQRMHLMFARLLRKAS